MRFGDIIEAIGYTPIVELPYLSPKPQVHLFAKLEGNNPAGSLKDRIARSMIEDAERTGVLTKDKVILEATSGNTGIALAMIGRRKGYRVTVVMPENVSVERRQLLGVFGAEIILTEGRLGTNGAIDVAYRLAAREGRYFMPDQFSNPANPRVHYETTGPEIIADVPDIDVFVAGLGTGGTLTGVGRRLKEYNSAVRVVAVPPHPTDPIQGLRSLVGGFVPPILDQSVIDEEIVVSSRDATQVARQLAEIEGLFVGISSGAILCAALQVAKRLERGNVVAVLADAGWKYLSMGLWSQPLERREEVEGP